MAKMTIKEAQEILSELSEGAQKYVNRIAKAGLESVQQKVFKATTKAALKKEIEELVAEKEETKETSLDDCLKLVRSMVKGTKKERRIISPKELLPRLEELKTKLEAEKKFSKVDKLVANSGMTKEQLIEYLKG